MAKTDKNLVRMLAFTISVSFLYVFMLPVHNAVANEIPVEFGRALGRPAIYLPEGIEGNWEQEMWIRDFAQGFFDEEIKYFRSHRVGAAPSGTQRVMIFWYMAHLEDDSLWGWNTQHTEFTFDNFRPSHILDSVYSFNWHMALQADGNLWTWGPGEEMGTGERLQVLFNPPFNVMNNVVSFDSIDRGRFALQEDGTLWAWGFNERGVLGIVPDEDDNSEDARIRLSPEIILDNVASFLVNRIRSGGLALKEDGSLWAWGRHRRDAGDYFDTLYPIMIAQSFTDASARAEGQTFVADDGTEWRDGYNPLPIRGESRIETRLTNISLPEMRVPDYIHDGTATESRQWVSDFIQDFFTVNVRNFNHSFTVRGEHRYIRDFTAHLDDGSIWRWRPPLGGHSTPMLTLEDVFSVCLFGGGFHTVLKNDTSLWTLSDFCSGKTREEVSATSIGLNHAMNDIVAAGMGSIARNFLALRSDNTLWAWGPNDRGQVGDGTTIDRNEPVMIMDNVVSAFVGWSTHFGGMALRGDGSLWAWGQVRDSHDENEDPIFDSPTPIMLMRNFYEVHGNRVTGTFVLDDGTEWNHYNPMRQMVPVSRSSIGYADDFLYNDESSEVSSENEYDSANQGSTQAATEATQGNIAAIFAVAALAFCAIGFASYKILSKKRK